MSKINPLGHFAWAYSIYMDYTFMMLMTLRRTF